MAATTESSQSAAELLVASIFLMQRERARGRESFFRVAWPPESSPATVFVNMRTVEKRCMPEALQVVAATVVLSHQLSATPDLHFAFWIRLLRIQFGWGTVFMGLERWLPPHQSQQLRVVLDYTELSEVNSDEFETSLQQFLMAPVGHRAFSSSGADGLDGPDASIWSVAELFSALSQDPDQSAVVPEFLRRTLTHMTASKVPFNVGLLVPAKFVSATRRLVNSLAANSSQQLAVTSLDIRFGPVELDVKMTNDIVEIVEKSHLVHRISDFSLDRIQVQDLSASPDVRAAQTRRLVLSVFHSPPDSQANALKSNMAPGLNRLGIKEALRCVANFEAVCSALRYGCPYAELSLIGLLNTMTDQIQRNQCWQWIAFGVFYPRSSACVSEKFQLRKVDMTGTLMTPDDVDAFVDGLRDPSRALLAAGDKTVDEFAVRVCSVSVGTKIYSSPEETSHVIYEMLDSQSLEALGSRGSWLCVVVAGVGLGWTRQEREFQPDATRSSKESFPCGFSSAPQLHLIASVRDTRPDFFEAVVPYLHSLDVRDEPGSLVAVCSRSAHLKHLGVVNCYLPEGEIVSLLQELSGSLGEHLESLSLSWRGLRSSDAIDRLCESLSSTRRNARLRELRLVWGKPTAQEFTKLYDMLLANQTLRLLELEGLPRIQQTPEYHEQRLLLETTFQGAKVRSDPLGMAAKLAFLSVVAVRRSGMVGLDPLALSLVFEFAATDVRRQIVWVGLTQ